MEREEFLKVILKEVGSTVLKKKNKSSTYSYDKGFLAESWGKVKAWLKGLLSWASEEKEDDSIIVKYVKKAITAVKEWFGKMFKFDSTSDIITSIIN